jgi:hypothetical protein
MAAGLGFKTFSTGDVLSATDVNGYLMQGVLVFASTAARDAAITSPQEGQFAFTKDTDQLWYRSASAWVASGATGDIEGVTAGVGITGGGTSGTVTITNDMATTITAAGDIVVGTGSGTYDNLPIGTTDQVLTADTTVSPYKVKWATAASSTPSYTLLNAGGTALTGATTITVNITAYNFLLVVVAGASSANASSRFTFRFNSDTASNYQTIGLGLSAASTVSSQNSGLKSELDFARMGANVANTADGIMHIFGAKGTGFKPLAISGAGDGSTTNDSQILDGYYKGTSTITSVSILSSSGNFDAGTIYIYGAN